jgi:pilus assembly protein CpaC
VVRSSGATVIDNMAAPPQRQVLLHVRFAEVDRTVLSRLSADLFASNPQNLGQAIENPGFDPSTPGLRTPEIETLAEGIVRLFLIGNQGSSLEALIRALKTEGHFRSLAEPNLVALEGEEATFLAGGEFPFPTVQAAGANGAVTIQWREFGVRLNFTPFVTNTGSIRLKVAPEVSSLDFANGLTISGFQIPALLSRKASTSIELRPGQHIAIAGLLDNSRLVEKSKIPILGDLPIIGAFFSSKSVRDRKTELLVIVTPHLVEPVDAPPALPTGETDTWDRKKFLKDPSMKLPAGVNIVPPSGGN